MPENAASLSGAAAADYPFHGSKTIGQQLYQPLRTLQKRTNMMMADHHVNRDTVTKLIGMRKNGESYKFADLQDVIDYEAQNSTRRVHGQFLANVFTHLSWLCARVAERDYEAKLDVLIRMVGSGHHNFFADARKQHVYVGKEVVDQRESFTCWSGNQLIGQNDFDAFELHDFYAYLDFNLKVFLHEFCSLQQPI